jgi:hypothetical protein
MMALFRDPGRNVMDRDDPVEDHDHDKNKQAKSKVVQKWVAYHPRVSPWPSVLLSTEVPH